MNGDPKNALHLISCLVEDRPGVLARIAGLISARGFNIDSLAVGTTQIPGISRISLVCKGDQRVVAQIVNQLNKLVDVIRVADLSWDDCLESELMLVKITAPAGGRDALDTVCRVFHARVNDLGKDGFIVEAAGRGEETDALVQALDPFGIQEVSRTGRVALQRGKSLDVTADLMHGSETSPEEEKIQQIPHPPLASAAMPPQVPGALRPASQEEREKKKGTNVPVSAAGSEVMTGADMIPRVFAQEGVDTVFGYSGGAILPGIDAFFRFNEKQPDDQKIKFIVPANEQGAGFMASGYARSTGKVGVAFVTSGPGATNTVTPVRDAAADSIPMVVLTGQVPRPAIGTDAFQEAPVFNIMMSCAKHVFLVEKPDELEATLRTAFWIARTGRPGPVVVDIPKDVQLWQGRYVGAGLLPLRGYRRRVETLAKSRLSEESARIFYEHLTVAERPLLYVGGGVVNSGAASELREFAEVYRLPVVTSLMGLGAMDNQHPQNLHMLGMHGTAYANYAVEDCDFLFSIGARFDDRVAGKVAEFAPNAAFIGHMDIDPAEIGKVKAATWSHVADAKQGLRDLIDAGRRIGFKKDFSAWWAHLDANRKNHGLNYDRKSSLIQPYRVLEMLSELTEGKAILTTGVGQHQMWSAQYGRHRFARHFITSGSMGTMGFGLPAAIGAQFANPGKTVINIDGDGSLRMNFGELETVTTYGLPVKILLLNNEGDGMVRQWQTLYFGKRYYAIDKNLHSVNFVKAAESMGFPFARRIAQPTELADALKSFVGSAGPAFLEVMIDPNAMVYPMVGPGSAYKDMVTGDWIRARGAAAVPEKHGDAVPDLF